MSVGFGLWTLFHLIRALIILSLYTLSHRFSYQYGYPPGNSFQSSFPTIERAYRTLVGILAALHVLYDAQAVSSLGIP